MPDVAATVRRLGGTASWAELCRAHRRSAVEGAVAGVIERVRRGRYQLPDAAAHLSAARASAGTLSHLSAAVHYGWKVATPPTEPSVTVRRKRRLEAGRRAGMEVHWSDLHSSDHDGAVTTPLRTVLDCARVLSFPEALAVADSALRCQAVSVTELRAAAGHLRGAGSGAARQVAGHADGRAANPMESVLRALTIEEGYTLTPQLTIAEPGVFVVADLGSEELQLIVEADGFEHHGTRRGLRKDCRRHTELAVFGWTSLRFSYEDVMHEQQWTRWALRSWRVVREGGVPESPPTGRQDMVA
ncbi:MAG: DUF559 domain-containing protein [Dermatophilaceae bacterium]